MKHKSIKSISFILALLLVILQCGVLSVNAASSAKGKTVYFKLPDEWKGRVDGNKEEDQYAGFMYPEILRSMPISTLAGNHDCTTGQYKFRYQ